jgi:DNA-binding response OmpR family regulator
MDMKCLDTKCLDVKRLLLVDDDRELGALLSDYLRDEGFEVTLALTAEDGLRAALGGAEALALAVLDVMLPDGNGLDLLRRIRAASELPVVMLTARGDSLDRVQGLELGADDYLPKPCLPRELVARVRAVLRRGAVRSGMPVPALSHGPLQMWPMQRRLTWDGKALTLTGSEFDLLEQLLKRVGAVVSKAELSHFALGRPLARFDRSIDVHISSIRHKLGAASMARCRIENIRGRGYQLIVE